MPPRRWTDDDLRAAVTSERSWQGVAKALGYQPNSTPSIRLMKRRVLELGISFDHFTAQRTWTYRALGEAIRASTSWSEVVDVLSLGNSADSRVRLRGAALRLDIDTSHLDPPPLPENEADVDALVPARSMLRHAAETIAASWFALCGLSVAVPIAHAPWDLLVTFPSGVKRVQVKSSTFEPADGSYVVGIGHRPYALDKSAAQMPYEPDLLDYFFVIDGDGVMYLIPIAAVAGRIAISVGAYRKYTVGDCSSLLGKTAKALTEPAQAPMLG